MILEYKVNEMHVQAAWLKTLYELIEEFDCHCKTYIEESYNQTYKHFSRIRVIEIFGSTTMLGWLKLRMERYLHFIEANKIGEEFHFCCIARHPESRAVLNALKSILAQIPSPHFLSSETLESEEEKKQTPGRQ